MARSSGSAITPWSPLKSGVLSGKYTRENARQARGRSAARGPRSALNDKTYDLIDELGAIAQELDTTVARVALAWVQASRASPRPSSARARMAQLDDNLAAAEVTLSPAHLAKLDALTTPKLNFPYDFIANGAAFVHGGMTINGRTAPVWPMSPEGDADRH